MFRLAQISLILLGLSIISCGGETPNGNNPPELTYMGLEKATMLQSEIGTIDSAIILLSFEDLDGDIGGMNAANITVTDNRDGSEYISLSFPELPNNGKPQQGSLTLTIPTTCCQFDDPTTPACSRNPRFPTNKFTVDITIEDLNGNRSNVITTDTLILNCF